MKHKSRNKQMVESNVEADQRMAVTAYNKESKMDGAKNNNFVSSVKNDDL
jgi:hypothetical protein